MARSKPRKKKVEKVRQERTVIHVENRIRKGDLSLLKEVTASIFQDCPPAYHEEPMGMEELNHLFDSDPEAPVILCTTAKETIEERPQVRIAVNRYGVERELRKRGLDENHPTWNLAMKLVGPALRDITEEGIRDAAGNIAAAIRQFKAVPAGR